MVEVNQEALRELEQEQHNQVNEFKKTLEGLTSTDLDTLRAAASPAEALTALEAKVGVLDAASRVADEAKDLTTGELIVVLQELIDDPSTPDRENNLYLLQLILEKLGRELPMNSTEQTDLMFLDWALETVQINPALMGALIDTRVDDGIDGTAGSGNRVLDQAIHDLRGQRPAPDAPAAEVEQYRQKVLLQAFKVFHEVPKIAKADQETRLTSSPAYRIRQLQSAESVDSSQLQFPELELFVYVVKKLERDGYYTADARGQEAMTSTLRARFRQEYDEYYTENPDQDYRVDLVLYEYPELIGKIQREISGLPQADQAEAIQQLVAQYLSDAWRNVQVVDTPEEPGIFSLAQNWLMSKNYVHKKPDLEKLGSALDLGDEIFQGMTKQHWENTNDLVNQRIDQYSKTLGEKIATHGLESVVITETRSVEELTSDELKEVQNWYATIGEDWAESKYAQKYKEHVLQSYCRPGVPCKKTFDEFIQEDYKVSPLAKKIMGSGFGKFIFGILDSLGDGLSWVKDFLIEKGVPLPEGVPTPEEQIQAALVAREVTEKLQEISGNNALWSGVMIAGIDSATPETRQEGLGHLELEQVKVFEDKILGANTKPMTLLREKNLALETLFDLSDETLEHNEAENGFTILLGTTAVLIPYSVASIESEVAKYRREFAESPETFGVHVELKEFEREHKAEIELLPEDLQKSDLLVSTGVVVLNDAADDFGWHEKFLPVLKEADWTDVTVENFAKLASALTREQSTLEFAQIAPKVEASKPSHAAEFGAFSTLKEFIESVLDREVENDDGTYALPSIDRLRSQSHETIGALPEAPRFWTLLEEVSVFGGVDADGMKVNSEKRLEIPLSNPGERVEIPFQDPERFKKSLTVLEKVKELGESEGISLLENWAAFDRGNSSFQGSQNFFSDAIFPEVYETVGRYGFHLIDETGRPAGQPDDWFGDLIGATYDGTITRRDGTEVDTKLWEKPLGIIHLEAMASMATTQKERIQICKDGLFGAGWSVPMVSSKGQSKVKGACWKWFGTPPGFHEMMQGDLDILEDRGHITDEMLERYSGIEVNGSSSRKKAQEKFREIWAEDESD